MTDIAIYHIFKIRQHKNANVAKFGVDFPEGVPTPEKSANLL